MDKSGQNAVQKTPFVSSYTVVQRDLDIGFELLGSQNMKRSHDFFLRFFTLCRLEAKSSVVRSLVFPYTKNRKECLPCVFIRITLLDVMGNILNKKIILKFACVTRSFYIHWIALGMTISSRLGTVVQFFPVSHGIQRTLLHIPGFHLCIA